MVNVLTIIDSDGECINYYRQWWLNLLTNIDSDGDYRGECDYLSTRLHGMLLCQSFATITTSSLSGYHGYRQAEETVVMAGLLLAFETNYKATQ